MPWLPVEVWHRDFLWWYLTAYLLTESLSWCLLHCPFLDRVLSNQVMVLVLGTPIYWSEHWIDFQRGELLLFLRLLGVLHYLSHVRVRAIFQKRLIDFETVSLSFFLFAIISLSLIGSQDIPYSMILTCYLLSQTKCCRLASHWVNCRIHIVTWFSLFLMSAKPGLLLALLNNDISVRLVLEFTLELSSLPSKPTVECLRDPLVVS